MLAGWQPFLFRIRINPVQLVSPHHQPWTIDHGSFATLLCVIPVLVHQPSDIINREAFPETAPLVLPEELPDGGRSPHTASNGCPLKLDFAGSEVTVDFWIYNMETTSSNHMWALWLCISYLQPKPHILCPFLVSSLWPSRQQSRELQSPGIRFG